LGHDWPPHLRRRDAEVFADLLGEVVVDLGVSGTLEVRPVGLTKTE
jgi:hypothetical protein